MAFTSRYKCEEPRKRAFCTCELAGFRAVAEVDPDLVGKHVVASLILGRKEKEMRKTGAILLGLLIVAAGLFVAPRAEASPEDFGIRNFEELDRADLRAKHVEVITQVMLFSEKEAQAFWPVFRDYEGDLMKLSDKMIQISKDYVQHYETMTEEMANELAERFLDWQAGRVKLMRHYYKKFSKALSPKVAAKFIQLENQLWILMDLKIASTLPLLK